MQGPTSSNHGQHRPAIMGRTIVHLDLDCFYCEWGGHRGLLSGVCVVQASVGRQRPSHPILHGTKQKQLFPPSSTTNAPPGTLVRTL